MAGLLDVSAKPKTHCSLLARRPLLYFDLWLKRLSSIWTITPGPPNSTGVDSSLVEQTSLKYWNICITVFSSICTCLSTELTFVPWLHRYVTYNHLSKVMRDLSKNDPARMVRYVRRFGHLWLAQRHPKPSLADVSVWLPFSSLPSAITATYWTCCKTETARWRNRVPVSEEITCKYTRQQWGWHRWWSKYRDGYLNQKFFTQYYENDQTTTTAKYQQFSRNCGCPTPTYRFLKTKPLKIWEFAW